MSLQSSDIPARRDQVNQLIALLCPPTLSATPFIFIHGHSSTGKSLVLSQILSTNQLCHVLVNCVEYYSESLLFSEILSQLTAGCFCESMNSFIRKLKSVLSTTEDAVYLVFDKADSLRDRNVNLIPALADLQRLTSRNISVIFVSTLPWDKFCGRLGLSDPFVVFFPDYNKDEAADILCHLRPYDVDDEFYKDYVAIILSVFLPACRDFRELQHLAEMYFPVYRAPVLNGEVKVNEKQKLWKRIQPELKEALIRLHLGSLSSGESPHAIQPSDVDLPLYSKFLLIASYIASFNPSRSDRRFFLKRSGRLKKKSMLKKDERRSNHLRGPTAFSLNRMMAIFYSIIDGRAPPSASLFTQVTSLVTLHLLNRVGHDDVIDNPKYRCSVSLNFINKIARTVDFDIVQYLYDFI